MARAATTTPRTPKPRSRWWRVHAWAGLKLSLFAGFVFLTGTLGVFAHEMDWIADRAMRADAGDTRVASWGTIAANVADAVPGGTILSIARGPDPWFATTAIVRASDRHLRRALVDPATGRVNRVAGFGSVERFLRDIHRRLMLPAAIGIPIVTSLSFVLVTSLVTGLMVYKKWWRGFFRFPKRRSGARRLAGDLHRLLGLWSLWFVTLVALTSFWYLIELLGAKAPETAPHASSSRAFATAMPVGARLDRMVATAHAAYPELDIRAVQYPIGFFGGIGFTGQGRVSLTTDTGSAVWIDPGTGQPVKIVRGERLSVHQRIAEMADPLHFGTFGHLWTKVIWFLFGSFLTALSVTGAIIYAKRLADGGSALTQARRGMGYWGYAALALIVLAFGLSPWVLAG